LYFRPATTKGTMAVRAVRGAHLGQLITVRGIVTRVSEVKPYLLVDAYSCDACGAEIFQEVNGRQYLPLSVCLSKQCSMNRTKGVLHQQTRASKFTSFQEVKVQEMVRCRGRIYLQHTLNPLICRPIKCLSDTSRAA